MAGMLSAGVAGFFRCHLDLDIGNARSVPQRIIAACLTIVLPAISKLNLLRGIQIRRFRFVTAQLPGSGSKVFIDGAVTLGHFLYKF